jgi:DNA-binding PadR family transcriptional regulator
VVLRELEDEDLATSALEAKRAGRGTQRRYYGLTPAGQELVERHRRGSTAR